MREARVGCDSREADSHLEDDVRARAAWRTTVWGEFLSEVIGTFVLIAFGDGVVAMAVAALNSFWSRGDADDDLPGRRRLVAHHLGMGNGGRDGRLRRGRHQRGAHQPGRDDLARVPAQVSVVEDAALHLRAVPGSLHCRGARLVELQGGDPLV